MCRRENGPLAKLFGNQLLNSRRNNFDFLSAGFRLPA
jgi:hypothetical protein